MRTSVQKTTHLGELVATVFDEAARYSADPQEVSHLATWALANIFRKHDSTLLANQMSTQRPVARAMHGRTFKPKATDKEGSRMTKSNIIQMCISIAAFALAMQVSGCTDLGKADDYLAQTLDSVQPKQSMELNHSDRSKNSAQPDPSPEDTKRNETPDDELKGACSESDREDYIHDANQKFVNQMRSCSKETWADKKENTACLTKNMPSLSDGCVNCFVKMASCAYDNCKMACMFNAASDRCTNCANKNCQASLVKCTGVARTELP